MNIINDEFSDTGRDLARFPHGWYIAFGLALALGLCLSLLVVVAAALP